jgi:hypothetical protein
MKTRFYATEVLPAFRDQIIETEIFRQNDVAIIVRVRVNRNHVIYMVEYRDGGYLAFKATESLEQALIFAETVQVVQ